MVSCWQNRFPPSCHWMFTSVSVGPVGENARAEITSLFFTVQQQVKKTGKYTGFAVVIQLPSSVYIYSKTVLENQIDQRHIRDFQKKGWKCAAGS